MAIHDTVRYSFSVCIWLEDQEEEEQHWRGYLTMLSSPKSKDFIDVKMYLKDEHATTLAEIFEITVANAQKRHLNPKKSGEKS